jgi:2-hydroxychromene-2-carboxylate isomerase
MSRSVEFFFDVGSPAAYLAWTQLPALAAATGAGVVLKPMLLGGVFQATGNASPVSVPAKGRYVFTDLQRCARRFGVPLQRNPHFPINTLVPMRAAAGVQLTMPERLDAYLRAVFEAIWVKGLNLNDPAVVAEVWAGAGFDPAVLMALANEADTKAALRATTEEAVARGVFGAPTMFVGDEMFFGQDRLDFVRDALAAGG